MNEHPPALQPIVNRRLSFLEWDEQRTRRVLSALEPEGGTIMKKKLTLSLALVAAIVLMVSVALAATTLLYSPSASAIRQARSAVMEQYGLTHTTLGLFTCSLSMEEDVTTVTFGGDLMASYGGNAGDYTVTLQDGEVTVSWTHDEADPALWLAGDLSAPIWGQPQLEIFLRERTIGGTVADAPDSTGSDVTYECATNTPAPPAAQEPEVVTLSIAEVTPGPDDLTKEEALAIARAALMENYGLTETDLADDVDFTSCQLRQIGDYSPRVWCISAWCQMDGYDWYMSVELDASTGEILAIHMQTGGNG